ncbi:glycosyltransferase family 2 protein [Streptococcus suis]|uniref:Exopolysaccharide biosynthesis protein, sugar transferase n=1 Tax=Streptococcus suis TaxID=1307 RepID=A0A0Z8EPS1_STRSU|nr:glycosyltransferase [Streptococcus suis]NQH51603.1 glycosyltransferase [Streptococcus suis]CYU65938.1 exopolysaccharide biosynthesis protein%2C sugar transferase [Streptococcus suis]
MSKILLSVIIPVYQVEKYLKRCIDSVLAQKFIDYEIILVDDGSTDSSPAICDAYSVEYPHISVIHKENGGLSDARNVGIKHAVGEYIFFLDSDDWISPTMFESLKEIISSKKHDIIHFDLQFCKNEQSNCVKCESNEKEFSGIVAFQKMLECTDITSFSTDKLYRVSLFLENRIEFPVGAYYEDLGTIYKLFLVADSVYYTNQAFYCYFLGNENAITKSYSIKKIEDMYRFFTDIFKVSDGIVETEIAQVYYINAIVFLYMKILEHGFVGTFIEKYILQVLKTQKVTFKQMVGKPNFYKYILYRAKLLPLFSKIILYYKEVTK